MNTLTEEHDQLLEKMQEPQAQEAMKKAFDVGLYEQWIEQYVALQPDRFVRGRCDEATRAMVQAFPELRRVGGFVYTTWGRDQHWWCVAPDGKIVDPTAEQFPVVFEYQELDLTDPRTAEIVPTGVCMDCGEDTFRGENFCSEACEQATLSDLNSF